MRPAPPIGIRDSYPRLPVPLPLRAWAAAARPFTLLAPLVGALLAGAASGHGPRIGDGRLALGVLTLGLATIGGNLLNQATDLVADAVNRPYRPVVRGLITPPTAAAVGFYTWLLSLACAALLGTVTLLLVLGIVAFSYSYSAPPLRVKRIPWAGNASVALARGVLGWCAAWTLWAPLTATALAEGLVLSLFLVGATTAKDFADAEGDAREGVRTLVVKYGPQRAALLSLPFIVSPLATLPLLAASHLAPVGLPAGLLVLTCIVILLRQMLVQPFEPNTTLEGTRPWVAHYATLLALMLAFATATPLPF